MRSGPNTRTSRFRTASRSEKLAARHGGRHLRSVLVYGWFGVADLILFVLALRTGRLEWLLARYVLVIPAMFLAQPTRRRQPWSSRQSMIAWTALLVPGVGCLFAAFWSSRKVNPQGAWQDVPVAQEAYRSRVDWSGVLDVMPLIDVLEGQDPVRKKEALLRIQTMRSAVEVSVVRQALDDDDPEVRYYAASLLSYVEKVNTTRISKLEARLADDPEDVEAWNKLAAEYGGIIAKGIAGEELSRFFLEKRLAALDRSLALERDQPLTSIERADTLLALGRSAEAVVVASSWVTGFGSEVADAARAVLIRAAYERQDQRELRRLLGEVADVERLPEEVRGLARLWHTKGEEA
jgi:polysaccharide biosynthesis protein PelE